MGRGCHRKVLLENRPTSETLPSRHSRLIPLCTCIFLWRHRYEATRDLTTTSISVKTGAVDHCPAKKIAETVAVVPILRRGLRAAQAFAVLCSALRTLDITYGRTRQHRFICSRSQKTAMPFASRLRFTTTTVPAIFTCNRSAAMPEENVGGEEV